MLEDEIGELDEKHRQFVAVCELCAPQDHMATYRWIGNGCPPSDRLALCKAFIAKAVWNFATTRDLIDAIRHRPALRRLCGWETLGEVPSEATFSRAFDAFARDGRPQRIHGALIQTHYGEKIAGHISRDATAIHAREKAIVKPNAASADAVARTHQRLRPRSPLDCNGNWNAICRPILPICPPRATGAARRTVRARWSAGADTSCIWTSSMAISR
jgi:hypothetical protein